MKIIQRRNKNNDVCFPALAKLAVFVLSSITGSYAWANNSSVQTPYIARNVEFDPSFLNLENSTAIDLNRFANGAAALPGKYHVAIYVNNDPVGNEEVELRSREDKSVYPCLTSTIIKSINFNYDTLPKDVLAPLSENGQCLDLHKQLPQADALFDSGDQRLDIVIPQLYMNRLARGSTNPQLWDKGVTALMLGYNLNGYSSESQGSSYQSFFAGINAGLNLGGWYLRHNGSYSGVENGEKKYNSINTYVQRDFPTLKARALIGQANTTGQVFDTLPFSGAQLASDDRMLPDSQRGYAPEIRGIARTNAEVTVRQNGQIIYQTTVSPGAFLIDDIFPTGYGGNLEVTVREADGNQQVFTVPYASVAQLLRPGSGRFSVTAGELRDESIQEKVPLYQATYQRGLTNLITGYGGVQGSKDYYAAQLGAALGSEMGAVAFDVTQAQAKLGDAGGKTLSGQSYQLSYSKLISETNSNLSVAAYRFSTEGYMDFYNAMRTRDSIKKGYGAENIQRAKNRVTLTASQGLPAGWGQFYISGSLQNYWNSDSRDKQFQMGYNNRYKMLSYSLSATRTYSYVGATQTNFLLNFSFPLGQSDRRSVPQMSLNLNRDSDGNMGEQASLSGSAGGENQFSYGVSAMNANKGAGTSGSATGQYRSSVTNMTASYALGKSYSSLSGSLSGAVVAHPGGVSFSPYISDTYAIIEAPGAQGASVSSYPGVYVDSWGYALVPYLNPYQLNEVSIDPKGMSTEVEIDSTSRKVAPYSGAVVMLKYATRQGTPVLIMATLEGQPVPFGADVFDSKGNGVGSVGQGGEVYARVAEQQDVLTIKWGDGAQQQCRVNYMLMPQAKGQKTTGIQRFNTPCRQIERSNSGPKNLAHNKPTITLKNPS